MRHFVQILMAKYKGKIIADFLYTEITKFEYIFKFYEIDLHKYFLIRFHIFILTTKYIF